jgi:MOSC domain-containing protein YiiM
VWVTVGPHIFNLGGGLKYSTSINKRPVNGAVPIDDQGLAGDRSADAENHGGSDKAICCYPSEHYEFFAGKLGLSSLDIPSFGENFTTVGLLEDEVCIGDTYRAGEIILQVSQPRQPCWKLANKLNSQDFTRWVVESSYSGFYLRVLNPGEIAAGAPVELVQRLHDGATIANAMAAMYSKNTDTEALIRFCGIAELSSGWREQFAQRMLSADDA